VRQAPRLKHGAYALLRLELRVCWIKSPAACFIGDPLQKSRFVVSTELVVPTPTSTCLPTAAASGIHPLRLPNLDDPRVLRVPAGEDGLQRGGGVGEVERWFR
jgi:hypothetical protein